jgi:ABC-type transport system involved in multi-copper enzyme maturation permease subunit
MSVIRRLQNPVLIHEWKVRMRSNRSAWITTLYLLVLGALALTFIFFMTEWNTRFDPERTREIFLFLSVLQLAMICLFTPGLTAGVISGERERQTLSILLTTNLTATKLILGKWLSSLSFMIYLVFASLPLYGIVFLFGGIAPMQMIEVFGLYLVTMLGLGSVGVLFSTIFKRTGVSIVFTYAALFGYTAGTFFFSIMLREFLEHQRRVGGGFSSSQSIPIWPDMILSLNPFFAIIHVFEEGIALSPSARSASGWPMDPYWLYLLFFVLMTILFLLLAIYLIKPVRPRLFKK